MTIYYWPGADHDVPSGGVRTHYEHVAHLRALGYDAAVLHLEPGFRCTWFEHDVPIAYAPTARLGRDDVLVMSEIVGPSTAQVARGVRKVVFAQNVHYVWRGWPIAHALPVPYRDPEVVATLVLTDYEREHFAWAFPEHPVHVVPHGIDGAFWRPLAKRRQIAYMPRKHADEAQAVFGWLAAKGALDGWDVIAIDGANQRETARILGESLVFFAFGYPEGGTLPPFEAAASGCAVLGYGGFASDDLLLQCGGWLVPSGDTCAFARDAAEYLALGPGVLATEGLDNRDAVLRVLAPEKERAALAAACTAILADGR